MEVRRHIYFSGTVQGVGFRYRSSYLAQSRNLTGWVKNLYDNRVEMEVQGEERNIEKFLADLQKQRFISIENMEMAEIPCVKEAGFRVTY
ncbi:MAG: acylphosphatase [Hungatella sp.]|mgnify:CR=1 FL=1|nr:acylphosphatase [Hungatella sp.]